MPMVADSSHTEAITGALFGSRHPGESLYAVLDAAQNSAIPLQLRTAGVEHDCLYQGATAERLWFAAPYLARCEAGSDFVSWLVSSGWEHSWGIFLTSAADLHALREHFRRFLIVKIEGERPDFYFRFYDPRVLRVFLPTCTLEEATAFFGPVRSFLVEDQESRGALRFTVSGSAVTLESPPFQGGVTIALKDAEW
jgi:Domain of unknown function (DUF4123)